MLKIIIKSALILIVILLSCIFLYVVLGYFLSITATDREEVEQTDETIYILTNGVHTDIVMPIKSRQVDWGKKIKYIDTQSKDSLQKYVAVGWGDKGFYLETPTWGDLTFRVAYRAAFGLGPSALHTTFYKEMIESETCIAIHLSTDQYARLIDYIDNSFDKNESFDYQQIETSANYSTSDAFYEAKGRYSIFTTCNTWANNALKACGQKAALWTPLDKGIFYHYDSVK